MRRVLFPGHICCTQAVATCAQAVTIRLQARALFPGRPIACLASFGTGRFAPAQSRGRPDAFTTTVGTLADAATRTEDVHALLSELMPEASYFRFNPEVPVAQLDEIDAGALRELQQAGVRAVTEGEGGDMLGALVHALRLDEEGARREPSTLCAVPARLFAALRSRL